MNTELKNAKKELTFKNIIKQKSQLFFYEELAFL